MGNPAVVFTTYSINSSTSWATTNVSGHAANSTSSPFVEIKSDLVPQSAKFSNGDFSVTDSHTKKIISFPCDQHLSLKQMNYIINTVKKFYKKTLK